MIGARKNISQGKIEGAWAELGLSLAEGTARINIVQGSGCVLPGKIQGVDGSACVMQLAELFDQHFTGDQFQLEIERALHENLDRFLRGHYILLPWEWFCASSAVSFAYLIGGFAEKLDWGNERAG